MLQKDSNNFCFTGLFKIIKMTLINEQKKSQHVRHILMEILEENLQESPLNRH